MARSTGATFRGFLRRLYPANAAPTAGRGPIVVILGGATREAIPYVEEFEQAQEPIGPGRFRLELALGGARVDDDKETTLPDKIKGLSLIAKEIMDRGGRTYVSGLRGMLKQARRRSTSSSTRRRSRRRAATTRKFIKFPMFDNTHSNASPRSPPRTRRRGRKRRVATSRREGRAKGRSKSSPRTITVTASAAPRHRVIEDPP